MTTDFTNNNTTISASGALRPKTTNTPLDIRTRVNSKADIDSIPNPFVGMKIIVLQDETNGNQMTEYVVISLKANSLGIADSKINEVVLAKDFLGVSSASGSGMTSEQVQQLNTAYTHSQTPHVQQSDIPTRIGQLENDSNFISSIPEEYVTEQELNSKGLATETFVTNKIAEAQLGGGEGTAVDLSGLGADLSLNGQTLKLKNSNGTEIGTGVTLPQTDLTNYYTKTETDNIIQDYTGGKKQIYLTQAEYDLLTDSEKNDATKVYNITDATEQVIPTDLTIDSNNLLQLKDSNGNTIGTGVAVSTASEYTLPTASNTVLGGIKVGDRLSIDSNGVLSADIQESTTSNEVILTSPSGYRFKVIVNDEGVLSTKEILTLGNIIASVSELSINEGESATFTISLSETPTRAQTISIVSDNTDVTVNPSSIAISDTNPHTITVSVAEDDTDYADETATLTLSSANVSNVTINVAIKDNDIEPKPCTGITLDQTSLSLTKGKTKQLIATVTPEGCTDEIVWAASNENCTVVDGLVKGVTEGDCIITATCGSQTATCTVTIVAEQQSDITTDGLVTYFDARTISGTNWNDSVGNATATLSEFTNANGNGATGYSVNFRNGASKSKAGKVTYSNVNVDTSNGMTVELVTNLHEYKTLWENFLGLPNMLNVNKGENINLLSATFMYYDTSDTLKQTYLNYLSTHLPENEVVHIFFVYDPQGIAKVYCNATDKVLSNTIPDFKNWATLDNATFAHQNTEQELYALRFYNRVLNEEEIAKNLSETLSGVTQ